MKPSRRNGLRSVIRFLLGDLAERRDKRMRWQT
jgi:hypothetical protein